MTPDEFSAILKSSPEVSGDLIERIMADYSTSIKGNPLRVEYEDAVKGLSDLANELVTENMSDDALEAVARQLSQARRDLGVKYKDLSPELLKEYIYDVNLGRYKDPLGPTVDFLVGEEKSWTQIIESSYRPNPDVDELLSGFKEWMVKKMWSIECEYITNFEVRYEIVSNKDSSKMSLLRDGNIQKLGRISYGYYVIKDGLFVAVYLSCDKAIIQINSKKYVLDDESYKLNVVDIDKNIREFSLVQNNQIVESIKYKRQIEFDCWSTEDDLDMFSWIKTWYKKDKMKELLKNSI